MLLDRNYFVCGAFKDRDNIILEKPSQCSFAQAFILTKGILVPDIRTQVLMKSHKRKS